MSDSQTQTTEEAASDGAIRVRRALISVSDKTGVADFARELAAAGVEIISTGGTAAALREAGLEVSDVSELTGQEELLDGRVKTLHPRLHAALLARRDDPEHMATLEREGIEPIDLVCVNLYPFEETIKGHEVEHDLAIENIDIGGPTMIRAAAKNHAGVAVVVKPESYDAVCAELEETGGEISASTRHWLANEAFAQTARYDAAISRWFSLSYEDFPEHLAIALEKELDLAYGENPHQRAALYSEVGVRSHALSGISKLHGRALSFNNVLDLDSARALTEDLKEPACTIVKHNNPCGAAVGAGRPRGLRAGARLRPAVGVRGRDRAEPADRSRARRGPAQELRRGPDRPRVRGRRPRGASAEGGDPDPLRRGAAAGRTPANATSKGFAAAS